MRIKFTKRQRKKERKKTLILEQKQHWRFAQKSQNGLMDLWKRRVQETLQHVFFLPTIHDFQKVIPVVGINFLTMNLRMNYF